MNADDRYQLSHTSGWRWIHTCTNCGDHTDDDEHSSVCPKCGHQMFTREVGRWLAYHRNLSFWQEVRVYFSAEPLPPLRLEVEFRDRITAHLGAEQ